MENDKTSILKSLSEIEKALASIQTAKKQVDSVVSADDKINQSIKTYALELSTLSAEFRNIKSHIEDSINLLNKSVQANS